MIVSQLVLGIAFTVATAFIDPLSAITALAVMPFYTWFLYGTIKSKMRVMAAAARPVLDPARQSRLSLVVRWTAMVLLLAAVMLVAFLWGVRGDNPSGVLGGILIGNAVIAFLQLRWWHRWEELYGTEMLYERGWSWRDFWKGPDGSKCWFVPARGDQAEATVRRPAVTGDDGATAAG